MASQLDDVTWPLRTERLSLRPATREDAEATWGFRRLEVVSEWITRAPQSLEDYREQFEDPVWQAKTLVFELDGRVIGDMMLAFEDAWAQAEVTEQAEGVQAELGYVMHPDHAGLGYASEAVRELLRLCFEELGVRRVTASCFADNESSWRLMERVGMRRELYAVKESLHRSGAWLDGMGYALLAEEWRSMRADAASAGMDRAVQP